MALGLCLRPLSTTTATQKTKCNNDSLHDNAGISLPVTGVAGLMLLIVVVLILIRRSRLNKANKIDYWEIEYTELGT